MKCFGFTVVELLVVVVLVGFLFTISSPFLFGALEKQRLLSETEKILSLITTAQADSKAAENAVEHGLEFDGDQLKTIPAQKVIKLDHSVFILQTNSPQIVFEKLTGLPRLSTGAKQLELTIASGQFKTTITVNQNGLIEETPIEKRTR